MKQLQPVIWMKGTFLSPQHLQTQDRFLENALRFQVEAMSYQPWGFTMVRIDQEALAGGELALAAASGIFPDGLMFDMPASDAPPPPIQLADCFQPDSDTVDVHLAIPDYRDCRSKVSPAERGSPAERSRDRDAAEAMDRVGGMNISLSERKFDTRYLAETILLRDENSGTSEKPVQVARKNFRLIAGDAVHEGMSALRVATVKRSPAGTMQMEPKFIPPILDISVNDYV